MRKERGNEGVGRPKRTRMFPVTPGLKFSSGKEGSRIGQRRLMKLSCKVDGRQRKAVHLSRPAEEKWRVWAPRQGEDPRKSKRGHALVACVKAPSAKEVTNENPWGEGGRSIAALRDGAQHKPGGGTLVDVRFFKILSSDERAGAGTSMRKEEYRPKKRKRTFHLCSFLRKGEKTS